MAQIRTKDTVDAVKELVSQLTPIYIIKEAIDNGNGTFTLSTNRTYWLTINKRITIDSIEYRIMAFEINVSITIKPITTGDPIPTVTFFTIPAPLFFHGVTLMAIDEQGKPKDPNQRTPFIWLYEILDETVIRDEFDPWGRNSKPQLFFMDESSLADWTSAQHKTNVLEPMRQMVELFFEKINDFQGDKYKEVLTSSQIGRANWGKFITDLGSVKKFFNEDLSGHQVGFDFTMSKTECDTRSANVVACNLTAQVTTYPETGEDANDGTAIATPLGGIGPYTYSWSGPSAYSSSLQCIVDLVHGDYTVVITDTGAENCSSQKTGTVAAGGVIPPCTISIDSFVVTPPTTAEGSDGEVLAVITGYSGDVQTIWSDGQEVNPAIGLSAGDLSISATDEIVGFTCVDTKCVTVPDFVPDNVLTFNRVNDRILIDRLAEAAGDFTYQFRIKFDTFTSTQYLLSSRISGSYHFDKVNNDTQFTARIGATMMFTVPMMTINTEYVGHYVRRSGVVHFYLDGVESTTGGIANVTPVVGMELIGCNRTQNNSFFGGELDAVGWNGAVGATQEQITALAAAPETFEAELGTLAIDDFYYGMNQSGTDRLAIDGSSSGYRNDGILVAFMDLPNWIPRV